MEIYFDNGATTKCDAEAAALMQKLFLEEYGNPSSMHRKGVAAEQYLREAVECFAKLLRADKKEIFFTSGGTESDNWALRGTAYANRRRGKHIIVSSIEHSAVLETAEALAEEGFEVSYLPVDEYGTVDLNALQDLIRKDTVLVSVMFVNNEIGSVQPLSKIGECIRACNPDTCFHVDAVQGFGKLPLFPKEAHIDLMSVSAHKLHGPKGVGLLYIDRRVKIAPLIYGGGQQNGRRSGTDNVPGIAGFACAAKKSIEHMAGNASHMMELKKRLADGLADLENVVVQGPPVEEGAPHIISISFSGIRSEVLLHTLEEYEIYVSAGSACSTHKKSRSATLTAIGSTPDRMESAIRFSFCAENTEEEVDQTLSVLHKVVPVLRKFKRR